MAEKQVSGLPSTVRVDDAFVISVRHRRGDDAALKALRVATLPWADLEASKPALVSGGWLASVSPTHGLVVTRDARLGALVLDRLTPGRHPSAVAVDVSEGHAVHRLPWPVADRWLASLADGWTVGRDGSHVWVGRLADVPAVVVRADAQSCWLVVEAPLSPHVTERLGEAALAVPASSANLER